MSAPRRQPAHVLLEVLLGCSSALGVACERLPTEPARSRDGAVRAMTFAAWSADGYASESAAAELSGVAGLGATSIWILITATQGDRHASSLGASGLTPSLESVRVAATRARSLGLDVVLKVHVDLADGTWRGHIEPDDPTAWFQSYRDFLLPWVDLAVELGSSHFVVGTELAGTVRHETLWRETIAAVRARYAGTLVYAASWDEASRVPFWDALDRVGVDAYFPVAVRAEAGRAELLAGWQPWLDRLERLHRQTHRPVLLTEIGYPSIDGAGMTPYRVPAGRIDLGEQADLYWAALQATGENEWIVGLVWWNWLAGGGGGPGDRDYTPAGKPAAQELASAWLPMVMPAASRTGQAR